MIFFMYWKPFINLQYHVWKDLGNNVAWFLGLSQYEIVTMNRATYKIVIFFSLLQNSAVFINCHPGDLNKAFPFSTNLSLLWADRYGFRKVLWPYGAQLMCTWHDKDSNLLLLLMATVLSCQMIISFLNKVTI